MSVNSRKILDLPHSSRVFIELFKFFSSFRARLECLSRLVCSFIFVSSLEIFILTFRRDSLSIYVRRCIIHGIVKQASWQLSCLSSSLIILFYFFNFWFYLFFVRYFFLNFMTNLLLGVTL